VGIAGVLLMAFLCAAEFRPVPPTPEAPDRASSVIRERRRRVNSGAFICAALAFGLYFWVGRSFITAFPTLQLGLRGAGLACGGAAIVILLTSARKAIAGGTAFVLFGAVMSLPVNPLYHGLGVLTSSPLLSTFDRVAARPRDPGHDVWLSYAGTEVNLVLLASGLQTLNAVDVYPDKNAWTILDPHGKLKFVWDRYANLSYVPNTSTTSTTLTLVAADQISIAINACSSTAGRLGIGFVVSSTPLTESCLDLDKQTTSEGSPVYIYTRSATQSG
jgi:hypothetical protein